MMKRLTALLLCLCLLVPALALGEDAHGVRFSLRAEMFPESYPQKDQSLMQGIADLLAILELSGSLQLDEDCIDLNAEVMLDEAEETRTTLRIYGNEAYWSVQSSLLGDQELFLNLQAVLEFCMKAYFHLDIPLQRVGLFVSPYVHKDGLGSMVNAWASVMNAGEGSRTIPRKDVLALTRQLSEIAGKNRSFYYWVQALALESGYDAAITDLMADLPEYAESFVDKKGITIHTADGNETWTTGDVTLFTRTVKDGWTTLSLNLPVTPDGYVLSGFCTMQRVDDAVNADLRLSITRKSKSILDLRLSADTLPLKIAASGDFALRYDVTGEAMPEGFHLLFEGRNDGGVFTLHQKDAATNATMLTISGQAQSIPVTSTLDFSPFDMKGLQFFSVSDLTLSQFIKDVQRPLLSGALPLLTHAPMSTCQSLMDLAIGTGVLDLLTASGSDVDETDEIPQEGGSYLDEENWDDVDWDDDSLYED